MGASLYACIVGNAPPRADERSKQDTFSPVSKLQGGRYSAQLLGLVDWCLHLDPLERPQSVYALQKALMQKTPDEAVATPWFSDLGARLKSFIARS